jgi:predicted ATPase/predicted Ser/Thr protein kinase
VGDASRADEAERLVLEWLEARERGVAADSAELVRQHPELADALREQLQAIELVDAALDVPDVAPPPQRLGRYRLVEKLGAGGMGTVFLAEDAESRRVALKLLHPHLLEREGFFKRFLREAELGRQVADEHVVRTLDADAVASGGRTFHFLVMEYVEGRTLRDLIDDMGRVPEALLREIAKQIASGLAAIHAAGIVHRDLKPENVVVTEDRDVRIMDLGVAKLVEASRALTEEGRFAGTLRYAAPEQFKGSHEVTAAADLYALGVMLFELATGAAPFGDDDPAALIRAQLDAAPRRITDVEPDASPFLADVVATLLAKEPSKRFASAAALREVLEAGEGHAWWTERLHERETEEARIPRVPVRRETTLFGRDADLAALRAAFDRTQRGEGNTVLLEGEAGIGKSRLVDAFLATLDAGAIHVLYGSYPPSGGMGALSDAVVGKFGAVRLDDALRPYMTPAPGLAKGLAATLLRTGEDALSGDAVHAALVHLMRGLAAERPLVLVADDLHFADADSRKVLLSLARAVAGHRVLLVLTTRPGVPEDELVHFRRLENFARLPLGRLSPREVVELLQQAFQSAALADKLGARIALASDGVPFFVFEMIRGLREGQFVTQLPDGSYVETKAVERIEVPAAVKDLVEARLSGLSKDERTLLDVGAVQGFEFDVDLVSRVVERRKFAVLRDLAEIERRSGVVRASGALCRFDHHQIQEVVLAAIPQAFRVECHAQLGAALEEREDAASTDPASLDAGVAVALAGHFLEGGEGPRALRYLDHALSELEKGYRNEAVIRLADLALNVPGLVAGRSRCDLLLHKARSLDGVGHRDRRRAAIDEAVALALATSDRQVEGRAIGHLGNLFRALGRFDEAREHQERSAAIHRELGDKSGEARSNVELGRVLFLSGRTEDARACFERSLALAGEVGDRHAEAHASGDLAMLFGGAGRLDEQLSSCERCLALSCEIGDRRLEAYAMRNLGLASSALGRYDNARSHCGRSLAICQAIGDRACEGYTTMDMGDLLASLGDSNEARALHERALAIFREIGDRQFESYATCRLGHHFLELGLFREAREHQERHLAISREVTDRQGEACALEGLGVVLIAQGLLAEAIVSLSEALDRARRCGEIAVELKSAAHLAALPGGDSVEALAVLAARAAQAPVHVVMEVRVLLWQATHDPTHLAEAKRLLDFLVEHAPPDCRESMLANVRLHREIAEAARAAGL